MKLSDISIKEINRLAIPAIIANIAEPLISLIDTAIIGKLGTTPLAAVGIASSFFLLIIWTLSQTKSAISALVSRTYGQDNLTNLKTFIPQAITSNFLLGIIFYVATISWAREIFTFYNADGELLEQTVAYFQIRAIGFPITLATYAIFGIFRGIQNTKWAMQISIVGGFVNLLLDVLLVYGVDSIIPSLGVEGAAYASLIAQLVMFIGAVIMLFKKSNLQFSVETKIHPYVSEFLKMSGNLFLRTIALNTAYFLAVQFATDFGEAYVAAHTMAMNIWLFSSFLIDGYANAGNAMSGKLIGSGNMIALAQLTKKLVKINLLISVILSLSYLAAYPLLGKVFSNDLQVVKLFNGIFWMVVLSQPINSIAFTYDGIYKGLGKTALLRNTLAISTFAGFVPCIFALSAFDFYLTGIWISFLFWMFLRGLLLHLDFVRNYKSA